MAPERAPVGALIPFFRAFGSPRTAPVIVIACVAACLPQVINTFLRQLGRLSGSFQMELARHPGLSFSCTVSHLCSAIRKLADVAMAEDYAAPLWR